MPTVDLAFTPAASHVRTARLVAAAVARRAGYDGVVLDEIRLAVGEACSRAVMLNAHRAPTEMVLVTITDDTGLIVTVTDCCPTDAEVPADLGKLIGAATDGALLPEVSFAMVAGLADEVEVRPGTRGRGTSVLMRWAAPGSGAGSAASRAVAAG